MNPPTLDVQLYQLAKKLDPTRLVINNDGGINTRMNSDVHQSNSFYRHSPDEYHPPIHSPLRGTTTYDFHAWPHINHEYTSYSVQEDPRLAPKYTGGFMPNMTVEGTKAQLADTGIAWNWVEATLDAGYRLEAIHRKLALESARLDPHNDGYIIWLLTDISPNSQNGILDIFYDPKSVSANVFRQYNGPSVIMAQGLPDAPIYSSCDPIQFEWVLSHFDQKELGSGLMAWTLADGKDVLANGQSTFERIPAGTFTKLSEVGITAPDVDNPTKARLSARINETDIQNSYDIWLFPKRKAGTLRRSRLAGLCDSPEVLATLQKRYPAIKVTDRGIRKADVILVDELTEEVVSLLEQGKTIVAVKPITGLRWHQPGHTLGWWVPSGQTGSAIIRPEAFGQFPHSGILDQLMFDVAKDALMWKDEFRNVEPLMFGSGGINRTYEDPALLPDYFVYGFQARVGSGKLLLTGFDLLAERPESICLLDEFISYARSDAFQPKGTFDPSDIPLSLLALAKKARESRVANRAGKAGEAEKALKEAFADMSTIELLEIAHLLIDLGYTTEAQWATEALIPISNTGDAVHDAIALSRELDMPPECSRQFGFVTDWWLAGPFPWDRSMGLTIDEINATDVDLNATYSPYGTEVGWQKHKTMDRAGKVDLESVFGPLVDAAAYGPVEITVPEATEAELRIGSDDGVKAWVNGDVVHEIIEFRAVTVDEDRVPIRLKAGKNRILLKVTQGTSAWGFCARITKRDGLPLQFTMETGDATDGSN